MYLAVLVASFSLEYAQTYMMQMIGQRIMFDMRMQIYTHLQRLDLSFYDRNPVGRLMTRVTTDVDVINDLFTSGVVAAFGDLFMLVGIMVTLLWMDWRLALIAFSVLPLILVLAQWFRRNVRESYRKVRLRIARINAFLNEHINGMATVQLFRREEVNYGRFELDQPRASRRQRRADFLLRRVSAGGRVRRGHRDGADSLVWRRLRPEQHAHARLARGVHPLRRPVLPSDQRHVGEVQHAPGRHGVFGENFSAPRHGGRGKEFV